MRRIARGWRDGAPRLQRAAPPTQHQPEPADQTELVICDQTIDEHRIGLKPLLRRIWAPIGQRPVATVQQRFSWRYLVGFVHPASERTVFHLATTVSIRVLEVELAEFARQLGASPSKQIVLVLDRAAWHTSVHLRVPEHLRLLFLPPQPLVLAAEFLLGQDILNHRPIHRDALELEVIRKLVRAIGARAWSYIKLRSLVFPRTHVRR